MPGASAEWGHFGALGAVRAPVQMAGLPRTLGKNAGKSPQTKNAKT